MIGKYSCILMLMLADLDKTDNKSLKKRLATDINSLRSPEGYLNAGIPNYNHLFGRDACISALQLIDYDPDIARCTLSAMVRYQATSRGLRSEAYPGRIMHEHFPGGLREKIASLVNDTDVLRKIYILLLWRFPYYGTVDAGAWFIILLHRYFKKTGDEAFLREVWPAALAVASWLETRATSPSTGLITYRSSYIFGLRNQSWKDTIGSGLRPPVAAVEVQGYYYEAYNCLIDIAFTVFADDELAMQFNHRAKQLKAALNRRMWRERDGYFSMAVNDAKDRDDAVASNPGHLLFTGILSEAQSDAVVKRLLRDDLCTPYGIRTLSSKAKSFDVDSYQQGSVWPFDNWVIYQGLLKTGHGAEAAKLGRKLMAAYKELDFIPELYTVSETGKISEHKGACKVQAWSAGALLNITGDEDRRQVL